VTRAVAHGDELVAGRDGIVSHVAGSCGERPFENQQGDVVPTEVGVGIGGQHVDDVHELPLGVWGAGQVRFGGDAKRRGGERSTDGSWITFS